jgi:hypothetical protein
MLLARCDNLLWSICCDVKLNIPLGLRIGHLHFLFAVTHLVTVLIYVSGQGGRKFVEAALSVDYCKSAYDSKIYTRLSLVK